MADEEYIKSVETLNDHLLGAGENLPNHSMSLMGRGKFVRQQISQVPTFRTRQAAYRYAAYLLVLAETHLPDEEGAEAHTFEVVSAAIGYRR